MQNIQGEMVCVFKCFGKDCGRNLQGKVLKIAV